MTNRGFINISLLLAFLAGTLMGHTLYENRWDRFIHASEKYDRWGSCMIISDDRYAFKPQELKEASNKETRAKIMNVMDKEDAVLAACREQGLWPVSK